MKAHLAKSRTSRTLALFAGVATMAGCAHLLADGSGRGPEAELERGVTLVLARNYHEAYDPLARVFVERSAETVGRRALLVLAASELDPRNPGRRMNVGIDIVGRYFQLEGWAPWQRPVIETLYLMALELAAAQNEIARAQEEAKQAEQRAEAAERDERVAERDAAQARRSTATRELPRLPEGNITAQVAALRRERNALQGERRELQGRVRSLEDQLAEVRAELERVRKTIKSE